MNLTAKIERVLADKKVPTDRADVKTESTVAGWIFATLGFLLMAAAAAFVGFSVFKERPITLVPATLFGGFGAGGFLIFTVAMTMISRDASPMIGKMGELLLKLARGVRGKS